MKDEAYMSFKYCRKCEYCKETYKKTDSGFTNLWRCSAVHNIYGGIYIYPGIENHQRTAPKECPYYSELYIKSIYSRKPKCKIDADCRYIQECT